MAKKYTKVALIYDFDETLSTGYMQDFSLIPAFGMKPDNFWKEANVWSRGVEADQVTGSMYYIVRKAKEKGIALNREYFKKCAENIEYYKGVHEWFDRINEYGKALNLDIEHFLISSGYEEILAGAEIRKHFTDMFACSYIFNEEGLPIWPARVINYSIKVQFLTKINKGLCKIDDVAVNEFMPEEIRPIPFDRMIYFGDGFTDIPSMKLVKERGGNAIAVYAPGKSKDKHKAVKLLEDNRVNFALKADYRENREIDKVVKTILDKIAKERDLEILKSRENKKKFLRMAMPKICKKKDA
jgi:phosphoserine phosphatase